MQCATPEAVVRVRKSEKLMYQADSIFDMYFTKQKHGSLREYLQQRLQDQEQDSEQDQEQDNEILVQVNKLNCIV